MSSNPLAETVASLMPRAKAELTELVAFRSVADFDQFPRCMSPRGVVTVSGRRRSVTV